MFFHTIIILMSGSTSKGEWKEPWHNGNMHNIEDFPSLLRLYPTPSLLLHILIHTSIHEKNKIQTWKKCEIYLDCKINTYYYFSSKKVAWLGRENISDVVFSAATRRSMIRSSAKIEKMETRSSKSLRGECANLTGIWGEFFS